MANTHSATLNGTTQYFTAADSASLSVTGSLTLETWVKFSSIPTTGNDALIAKDVAGQSAYMFYINWAGTRALNVYLNDTYNIVRAWASAEQDVWYHFVFVFDAPNHTGRFFVNGTQLGTDGDLTTTSINNTTAILSIGAAGNGTVFVGGLMDEVRISNSIRYTGNFTPQTAEYSTDANTMGLWHLNNSLLDETTNDNDLTNVGTATFTTDVPFVGASGPANLKSRSGNLKANIKSLSGNLIANCKSLSGNS